jgi:Effector-associated domain 1/CHAT domain
MMSDPASADLALTPEELDEFTREISTVFREYEAVRLLRLVGFPRHQVPDFSRDNRVSDWGATFRAIDDGLLTTPTPYRDLLRHALRRFPGNPVFARIEAADPTSRATGRLTVVPAGTRRVHVVQASPRDQARLHSEVKAIRKAAAPGHLVVTDSPDAGLLDLRALLDARPDILHVSGHGERGRLLFEDAYGETDAVPAGRVVELLATYRGAAGVRLSAVVLNSCDSAGMAEEFRTVADVVIAHDGPLDDECAVLFAGELYGLLRPVPDLAGAAEIAATHCRDVCPQLATNLVRIVGEP